MENTTPDSITDIRQSPQWGGYLEYLGWKKHSLGGGKNIYSLKTGPLTIAKIQRPISLNAFDLEEIDRTAQENRFAFVKLEPSTAQNIEELTKSGYKISHAPLCPPTTIFLDLTKNVSDLEDGLSSSARYSVRRAKREGGKVECFTQPSDEILSDIYPILKETGKKQKFFVPNLDDLITKLRLWGGDCHITIVRDRAKNIHGAQMFLGFNGNVWFINSGTTEEGRKTKFGYLLMWESVLYLKKKGYKVLDLEGKDDKRFPAFTKTWGGFSYFKEKFGGIEVAFPYPMIKYYSSTLKFLSRLYSSAIPL